MARRQYGTGSIYQRASDWRWIAQFEDGYTKAGARKYATVSGPGCEGGCAARCPHRGKIKAKALAKQQAQTRQEEASTRVTVKTWAATWLEMTSTTVRPKTHVTDKGASRYIVSTIGAKRLSSLTPADVRSVRTAVTDDDLSTATALRYHGTLMRMLKAAQAEGHDIPARVLAVRPPQANVNDRRAIPLPDAIALLSVAADMPHGSRWVAALLQGMRQGECLGLTWQEVDLSQETLTISWQLQALPYRVTRDRSSGFLIPDGYEARQLDGRMHLVRPKSRAGWRVIPLVPWMTAALKTWQQISPPSPHGLVWPALNAVEDRAEWARMQADVKVRHPGGRHYTPHEARHTTATLLLELGVPESVIVAIMGHSSIVSTQAYQHTDVSMLREALGRAATRLELGAPSRTE